MTESSETLRILKTDKSLYWSLLEIKIFPWISAISSVLLCPKVELNHIILIFHWFKKKIFLSVLKATIISVMTAY